MRRFFNSTIAAALALAALAGTPQDELSAWPWRTATNHHVYEDFNLPALTPAPAGYEAFHINHYGRHGSRWLTSASGYLRPVAQLERAQHAGLLTEQGVRLLKTLQVIKAAAEKRNGELSDVGAEQHQRIATRMYRNFPEVFAGNARVDARSTIVIRCILSMQNSTMTLRSLNPQLNITTDASFSDMHYMGSGAGEDTLSRALYKHVSLIADSIYYASARPERFIQQLYLRPDSINMHDAQQLMRDVFSIAGSLQNHHQFDKLDLFHLFSGEEIFEQWRLRNIELYLKYANSPRADNRLPFRYRELLRNIIETGDAAIASGERGARLRYGHESIVLPLACLMEINDINLSTDDLDNLHLQWQSEKIVPMACNMQLVFYRNVAGDVLVKCLFNEREARLPVKTDCAPYYHWSDLKAYYTAKINRTIVWN